jgi:hypothetical protein
MACSMVSWHGAQEEPSFPYQNNCASPLWRVMWWATVAGTIRPLAWHRWHNGSSRSWAARLACHLAVLYQPLQGLSCRRLASLSRFRSLRSSGLGKFARSTVFWIRCVHYKIIHLRKYFPR